MSAVPDDYEIGLEEHERRIEGEQAALAREDRKAERADAPASFHARFWSKVEVVEGDGCWRWLGYIMANGYGTFVSPITGQTTTAHRVAYLLTYGDIPEGLHLDHLCRNRACVNPDHLEAVSQAENTRRGESPWAINARRTHCVHGHAYDEANTFVNNRCERQCRTCKRASSRAAYAKRAAAKDRA